MFDSDGIIWTERRDDYESSQSLPYIVDVPLSSPYFVDVPCWLRFTTVNRHTLAACKSTRRWLQTRSWLHNDTPLRRHPFVILPLIAIHYCQSTQASRLKIDAALITDAELIAHRHPTSSTFLCDFIVSLLIVIYRCWLWFTSANVYFIVPLLIASHYQWYTPSPYILTGWNPREVSIPWIIVAVSELIRYW